ncbi:MAG: VWA domain-containing protein [Thermoanaerobaculia bacterium]
MTLRMIAVFLVSALAAVNTGGQTNNPEPAQAAVSRPDPTQTPGIRKLSRSEKRTRTRALAEQYRDFLRDVEPIIMEEELNTFLLMESDAQRDLFIEHFWRRRDSDPKTVYNEYLDTYYQLIEEAKREFRYLTSDRARIFLVQGRPMERLEIDCERYLQPLEVWFYRGERQFSSDRAVVFYQPRVGGGDFRLWQPLGRGGEDLKELLSYQGEQAGVMNVFYQGMGGRGSIWMECRYGEKVMAAINYVLQNRLENTKMFSAPDVEVEDLNRVLRSVVIANPDAPKIEAGVTVRYPGKRGARTASELTIDIDKEKLQVKDLEGTTYYNLDLTGEVLKDGKLFENFRYRYDFPVAGAPERLTVTIERFLRPADYQARIRIVDANSGAEALIEKELEVPYIRATEARREGERAGEEAVGRLFTEFRTGESQLRIIPLGSEALTGLQTIDTIVTGDRIEGVEFYLDGRKVMTKRRPPYNLELDFGEVPRTRKIKAIGLDAKNEFVAGDEIAVNIGSDPFRVWIDQPRISRNVSGPVRVELDASAPEGHKIDRLELWLNEARVATLFEKPWVQTVQVPADMPVGYLRAVAYLEDPKLQPVEDVVFLNSPDFLEEVDVHLVELPTTVIQQGKPVHDLTARAFTVLDEGSQVEIAKFERVQNLPLSIGLAVDASGSMSQKMEEAQKAGAQFFRNVLRPGDRAFVMGFDSQAYMVQKWSSALADLNAGLSTLRAEETTALFDALVYSLYNFQGIRGQKALVVISDGKDTASRFSFDQSLEYARRAAVPIYAIGIGIRVSEVDVKYKLNQLAKETGGNSYYIETAAGLGQIYTDIENELRSQYVLGFYPPSEVKAGDEWRTVEVKVTDGSAKTIRGYYP